MMIEKKSSGLTPEEIKANIKSINESIVQPNAGSCCGPTETADPEIQATARSCCSSSELGDDKDE